MGQLYLYMVAGGGAGVHGQVRVLLRLVWLEIRGNVPGTSEVTAVPGTGSVGTLRGFWILHHLAQEAMDLAEPGPLTWVLLPAVKHQSVQGGGAVPGGRQPEAILHGFDHLGHGGGGQTGGFRPPNTHNHPIPRKAQGVTRQGWKQVDSEEGPGANRSRVNGQRSGSNRIGRQGEATGVTHVLARHVPVGPLPKGHHLPHDDTEAPNITGGAEVAKLKRLGGGPQRRAPAALRAGRQVRGRRGPGHSQGSPPAEPQIQPHLPSPRLLV